MGYTQDDSLTAQRRKQLQPVGPVGYIMDLNRVYRFRLSKAVVSPAPPGNDLVGGELLNIIQVGIDAGRIRLVHPRYRNGKTPIRPADDKTGRRVGRIHCGQTFEVSPGEIN